MYIYICISTPVCIQSMRVCVCLYIYIYICRYVDSWIDMALSLACLCKVGVAGGLMLGRR